MSEKKLGRGLDFLLKRTTPTPPSPQPSAPAPAVTPAPDAATGIPVESISPNPFQPRREFEIEALNELIESIRLHGVLQPVAVRSKAGRYELISGERRWRACRELGLATIPAVIHRADDQRMLELALIENIQRQDLDAIEKAKAYKRLMDEFALTQDEAAKRLSQKRSTVANFIRLLDLPPAIRDMLKSGQITAGHARALLAITDPARQLSLAQRAATESLTVRDIEAAARIPAAPSPSPTSLRARAEDPHLGEIESRIIEATGCRTVVKGHAKRGRITIHYRDARSLQQLLRQLELGAERRDAAIAQSEIAEARAELA